MPVKRSVWANMFTDKSFPGLPCPQCDPGKLKLVSGSLSTAEPAYSSALHSHSDWDPDWVTNRFSARMKCDETDCGELVNVSGDTIITQVDFDEDGVSSWGYAEVLRPRSFFPAPPFFRIPKSAPSDVKDQLELAFQFFWADVSTSVGRLRTAIELMLDQQKIPTEKITKKGKNMRMDLAERIDLFSATATGDGAKEALHGLRYIGNLGTHGSSVTQEALFDAADVLEDVMLGIYENKSIKLKIKKLNDKKGKY